MLSPMLMHPPLKLRQHLQTRPNEKRKHNQNRVPEEMDWSKGTGRSDNYGIPVPRVWRDAAIGDNQEENICWSMNLLRGTRCVKVWETRGLAKGERFAKRQVRTFTFAGAASSGVRWPGFGEANRANRCGMQGFRESWVGRAFWAGTETEANNLGYEKDVFDKQPQRRNDIMQRPSEPESEPPPPGPGPRAPPRGQTPSARGNRANSLKARRMHLGRSAEIILTTRSCKGSPEKTTKPKFERINTRRVRSFGQH